MDKEKIKENFARKIIEEREALGLSQTELADSVGISRSSLSYYERNERTAGIDVLNEFADFFNCTTDALLGRKDIELEEALNNKEIVAVTKLTKALEALPCPIQESFADNFMRFIIAYKALGIDKYIQECFVSSLLFLISDASDKAIMMAQAKMLLNTANDIFNSEGNLGKDSELIFKLPERVDELLINSKISWIKNMDELINNITGAYKETELQFTELLDKNNSLKKGKK